MRIVGPSSLANALAFYGGAVGGEARLGLDGSYFFF